MIPIQPRHLYNYISFKRFRVPPGIKRLFYLSWEDALWDLLKNKDIPKHSTILLPSFYCGDVEKNIRAHDYLVSHYPVNSDLTVNPVKFFNTIKKIKPEVIVIFHPVGITSNLFKNSEWVNKLNPETILIEDSVHRVINPNEIKFLKENHFIINSLRKVVPLQGSSLYGKSKDLTFKEPPFYQSTLYSIKVMLLWILMNTFLNIGRSDLAEKLMITGYDLIGTSRLPARGLGVFKYLEEFIDFNKVSTAKVSQGKLYSMRLDKIVRTKINFDEHDLKNMRAWPLVLPIKKADKILLKIRNSGLLVRFELNDSSWSNYQKVIYLPLGPHLRATDIETVCSKILDNVY